MKHLKQLEWEEKEREIKAPFWTVTTPEGIKYWLHVRFYLNKLHFELSRRLPDNWEGEIKGDRFVTSYPSSIGAAKNQAFYDYNICLGRLEVIMVKCQSCETMVPKGTLWCEKCQEINNAIAEGLG